MLVSARGNIVDLSYRFVRGSTSELEHIIYKGSFISTSTKDAFFMVGDKIVKVTQLRRGDDGNISLTTQAVEGLRDLFTTGLNSSEIGIYKSLLNLSEVSETHSLSDIKHKLFIMPIPFLNEFALIPMSAVHGSGILNM